MITRNKGHGQFTKEHPFCYGRVLQLDNEDLKSLNLILLVDSSKGVRKTYVSEDRVIKDSCGLESFKVTIEGSNNFITTLRPYIQVHVTLREASPSPMKIALKKATN